MFKDFIVEKIGREVYSLAQLRYRNIIPAAELLATDEPKDFVYPGFVKPGKSSRKMVPGEFWSGRDRYLWLHTEFEAPREWKGKDVLGVFDFGLTGGGYCSGFESLLFIDGVPYQGVDGNHKEVFFKPKAGGKQSFDFRLWSGLEGGGPKHDMDHQIKTAFFCTLEPSVDELYYLLAGMVLTIMDLPDGDPAKSRLQNILTEGYRIIDFTNPGSDAFIVSVQRALEYYHKGLKAADRQKDVSVSFIGHTHIDLSWLWRYRHTREKGERSFSTVLRLMERYPEYIFLQTQAQIYDSVKEDHPDLFKAIGKRVAEGRWEASGAMWVEADCNIPSGESLVRQILYGKGFFKKEFGVENTFLWLPDVFGYNWALPQILKKSGIDTFITTKISWSEINRMPHDTFIWTGMDGSQVLTHFITTPDTGNAWFYTYNGQILPRTLRGIWDNYRDKGMNQDLLFAYGFGDGGGGVTRDMLESLRTAAKLPGLPAVKTERVDAYLKRLHKKISDRSGTGRNSADRKGADRNGAGYSRLLHNFHRELYLEYHRGTYTSQAYTKKMNRRLELLYRDAEILQSLTALKTKKWDEGSWEKLRRGWKLILRAQFHDIIPGSSIGEVYEDTKKDHHEAMELGKAVFESGVAALAGKEKDTVTAINTAGWKRGGLIALPVPEKGKVLVCDKGSLVTQVSGSSGEKKAYVWLDNIAPLGSAELRYENAGTAAELPVVRIGKNGKFVFRKNGIDTPFYKLKWDGLGRLTSLYDKQTKRETLSGPGNELQIFEDRPKSSDAWEIEATIDLKREFFGKLVSLKLEETGPLFTRIRFVWTYNKSKITQDMILYAAHKRIDFKTQVDWQERSKLLKVSFPVDINSVNARYEIQYGSLERNTTRSTSWDEAQFEVVGHQWADYSEKGFGVALMNDSKYGYDIKEGLMRLSLLKSAEHPDPEADRGLHEFSYAVYVHGGSWHESDLIPLAWDLNAPLVTTPGKTPLGDLVRISAGALDAVKKSEDGKDLIIRLHEHHGGRSPLKIEFAVPISAWAEADLMENPLGAFKQQQIIKRELGPFEIVTFRVKL
ncbi:MAG: alpha-mannosidase [Treponema sp.]|jgi:alpha-mannosidase|nr:alpha-mannosidase [Treponema sp.]